MTVPFAAAALLIAVGVSLLLERSLVRVLVGVMILGNGVNLLIVTAGGPAGQPPILGRSAPDRMADPLPQAMVLTSIVITLGVVAFLLAMVHRSWQLTGGDEVQDDTEDRLVRLRARRGELGEAVRSRQKAYQRLVADQRAELARLEADSLAREQREAADLESRILDVNVDLGRWMQAHKDEDLPSDRVMERMDEARREEEASMRDTDERVRDLREDYELREREQAAREKEMRRRLKARQREARRQMRALIRSERERQALALDPELEGDD